MNYNETIYHIYPLGFCGAPKENDGIVEPRIRKVLSWLEHFEKLNLSAIYFGPVFESERHGYDTKNYEMIDVRLGTNHDFKEVCDQLHQKNIKVYLDGVFNHVGRSFFAFQDVLEKKWDSPYNSWFYINYDHHDNPDGFSYADWEGHQELVKLNLENKDVRNYLFHVIDGWIEEFHIDGLRLDVAYCLNQTFLYELHHHLKDRHPDFFLLGEMIGGDYNMLLKDDLLDSVTNYECRKGLFSSFNTHNLFEIAHSLNRQFGSENWCLYRGKHLLSFIDNHDVDRIASILNDERDLPLLYGLLYTMPGIPAIYYGSEWGAKGTRTQHSDDDLRPCFDKPEWNSLTDLIAALNTLRKEYPTFTYGDYHQIYLQNEQYVFSRRDEKGQITCALNISDQDKECSFNPDVSKGYDLLKKEWYDFTSSTTLPSKSFYVWYTPWE